MITIVPEYRSYRYFVVDDQICIVEPSTYRSSRSSGCPTGQRHATTGAVRPGWFSLSRRKNSCFVKSICRDGSTLALGALTEGAEVPRDVSLKIFPATVVERVPKVRDYKYITAENRLAIVDPRGSKVELVLEARR